MCVDSAYLFEVLMSGKRMALGISVALATDHSPTVVSCNGISYISLKLSADWYPLLSAFLWPLAYR